MSVSIISGASSDLLTIDPSSKATRATLYDSLGREIQPPQSGSYITPFEVRCTSASAAGVTVFNFRGPTSLRAFIRGIRGRVTFDGTALAASGTLRFGFYRGVGASVPTGGTAQIPTKKDSTDPTSTVQDVRVDLTGAGLTTTGITYETTPFHVVGLPIIALQVTVPTTSATVGAAADFDLDFHTFGDRDCDFIIGTNEHLAIRIQTVAGIIGLGLTGSMEWDER